MKFALASLMLALAVVTFGCASSTALPSSTRAMDPTASVSPSATPTFNERALVRGFDNFKTAEAKAKDVGYPLYWLGTQFIIGDVVSKGPRVNDFQPDDVPGIVEVHYRRDGPITTATSDAQLTLFEDSPAEWQRVKDSLAGPVARAVMIAGKQAQFYDLTDPNTKTTTLRAVIDFGTTVVVAEARTLIGSGHVDVNLLTDEQTFLSVLQNLRPYPQ